MTKDLRDLKGSDIIDVRDVIARVEELRGQRTDRWVAGCRSEERHSQVEFDDCDEARGYVIGRMSERLQEINNELRGIMPADRHAGLAYLIATLNDAIEKLEVAIAERPDGDYSNTLDGVDYFVTKDGTMGLDEDETAELATLEGVLDQLKGYGGMAQWEGDWYPITLVRQGDFEDFARQEAEELGAISGNETWPLNHIDWAAAAKELEQDYSEVDFDGESYLYRD